MAGSKHTYQGVGFYESPGMRMSRWLDELWPQIPDKHNDSIYSDLAAWMQIDSVCNKFSQAKNLHINQAKAEKKKKKLTERNWAAETSPSRLHFIPWPRHALTDWHALSMPLKFSFSMFSNLCFLLCSCHMKMKQGSGDEEQKSAFNSWPRAGVSHQWLF